MKEKADYKVYDAIYKQTKEDGFEGWGGSDNLERINAWREQLEYLQKHVRAWPLSGAVLELGCGEGRLSFILARSGYSVTAIDVSETAIAWAKEKLQKQNIAVDFRAMSVVDLDFFAAHTFDIVFDSLCTHCIIGDDRKTMFDHVYSILKKDGVFILNTICGGKESAQLAHRGYFDEKTNYSYRDGIPYRYIGSEEDLVGELTKARLTLIKKEVFYRNGKPYSIKILVKKI